MQHYKRYPIEKKREIAAMLSHPDRPLQKIQNQQYPGLVVRQRRTEAVRLANTTAIERVLAFIARLARAAGVQ